MSNLVSNVGVVATDVTGAGTVRVYGGATQYGDDKGIMGYGYNVTSSYLNISNLVSNAGVIAKDVSGVGTARYITAACSYN